MTKEGEVCRIQSFLNFNFRHSLFDIRYSLTGLHARPACIGMFVRGSLQRLRP